MNDVKVGIIGGSGVYEIDGIKDIKEVKLKTPFGKPSDSIVIGTLEGIKCAFLPRHGKGHRFLPTEVNSQANIYALKTLGVERIIAASACGSLKEEIKPRDFFIPDQLFDRTRLRPNTFFGNGVVGHIAFDEPYCPVLSEIVYNKAKELGISVHRGGTYVCIEGPQFSTKVESEVNRKLGFSIVGMTALPEVKLAREAEICYVTIGLVTDYDVWKEGEEVTIEKVIENLIANSNNVKRLVKAILPELKKERKCRCATAVKNAIFTQPKALNKTTLKKLKPLVGRYIK
ncbi:MAG: S-methyl-5'-thioadenosine phosphorylase [Elusimicrobiota bacterium]